MSEVGRVHGPGGSEPGAGRKDRTKLDDTFTKIMEVGKVDETDPHKKKGKQKTVAETEDVEAGLKAASGSATPSRVKPMDQLETPLAIRKPETTKQPKLPPSTARPTTSTPLAAFSEEEIEQFAWDEEAAAPPSEFMGTAQAGYASSSYTSPTETETPPPPSRAGPSMEVDTDFADEARGEARSQAASYQEERPQTASYSPPSTFRPSYAKRDQEQTYAYPTRTSRESRPSRAEPREELRPREQQQRQPPSTDKAKEAPSKKEKREEEAEALPAIAEAPKPKAAKGKKALPPPGAPVLPGQKGEGLSFAEHMEEAKAKKEIVSPPSIPTKATVSPPLTPKEPLEPVPREIGAKEEKVIPTALPGIPTAAAGFPSGKPLTPTAASLRRQGEEGEVEGMIRPMPLGSAPKEQGADQGGEQEKKKREGREGRPAEPPLAIPGGVPTPAAPTSSIQATAPIASTPYAQMDPQIMAMFERMVGVMTIAHTTGISETTMTLNARQFATSVLYGSQIVIREFSTAPKAFNVEFIGSPQALALVQQNVPALLGAVQQGNFNFTINRFDAKLGSTEKPIFSRKESLKRGDKEFSDQENQEGTP